MLRIRLIAVGVALAAYCARETCTREMPQYRPNSSAEMRPSWPAERMARRSSFSWMACMTSKLIARSVGAACMAARPSFMSWMGFAEAPPFHW